MVSRRGSDNSESQGSAVVPSTQRLCHNGTDLAEPTPQHLIANEKWVPLVGRGVQGPTSTVSENRQNFGGYAARDRGVVAQQMANQTTCSLQGLIGSGGYGQIYYANDQRSNDHVAVKAEPTRRRGKVVRRMILEQRVLVRLQGQPHAPLIYGSGCERDVNFIVMQLLSTNLGDLRKQCPLRRFSVSTCGRVVMQAIAALRDLHNLGYIHRDVKPANMCFGVTEKSRQRLFLVDFGLVRRFRNADGTPRQKRGKTGFRGTLRYVSLRVHNREEQGPADDLMALFFGLLEMLRGELPWKNLQRQSQIKAAKEGLRSDVFLRVSEGFGEHIREFGKAVYSMQADDEPNYIALQEIMRDFAAGAAMTDPYDWENDYTDVLAEEDINRMLKLIF